MIIFRPDVEQGRGCCAADAHGEGSEDMTTQIVRISCAKDEGGPLGIGFQERIPNQSKLLRLRGVVVSVGSKVRRE